ncbi:hemerythrin domain-containing protein [Rhodosalinus sediminis]|uniref:hemerythrin domain-containing protein n=1 Tax=Rhodosalinus sediminis TaxID=1940533 RepID=UPI0023551330|nr:hemerythrin domain-containing protein [Rhodosalinus sediminis]
MKDLADAATEADRPEETGALIDHILTRYHEMHRADLASLGPLADRVERVHADDPDAPRGLARAIRMLAQAMEDHMAKEETILFPAMRAGGGAGIEHPIAVMRADHDDHAETVALIRRITRDLTPPEHACGAWRSLYGGVAALFEDLAAHIALENDVLFPRFEPR